MPCSGALINDSPLGPDSPYLIMCFVWGRSRGDRDRDRDRRRDRWVVVCAGKCCTFRGVKFGVQLSSLTATSWCAALAIADEAAAEH